MKYTYEQVCNAANGKTEKNGGLNVPDLKKACEERCLATDGGSAMLRERLAEWISEKGPAAPPNTPLDHEDEEDEELVHIQDHLDEAMDTLNDALKALERLRVSRRPH